VDNQIGKLRRTGILALLDGWCVSEEVGIRKPDPAIFALARQRGLLSTPCHRWNRTSRPFLCYLDNTKANK
jgi:hypothetical protein